MSARELIQGEIDRLSDEELQRIYDYLVELAGRGPEEEGLLLRLLRSRTEPPSTPPVVAERMAWYALSRKDLETAYDDDEVEYSPDLITTPNPDYEER